MEKNLTPGPRSRPIAVFLSGLNLIFFEFVFQVPGGGEGGGGSVEVRGMRGRHAGHQKLEKTGKNKFEKKLCTILSLFRLFKILGQGKMKGFPDILKF